MIINVLLVEDDWLVAENTSDELRAAGFEVTAVPNGDQALALLENEQTCFEVILSDIQMPGKVDGVELIRQAALRWPSIRLVLASGATRPTANQIPMGCRFFPKPYVVGEVVRHLRSVTAGP